MILLSAQYWSGDFAQMMRLMRRVAELEDKMRTDVAVEFVLRFDAPEVDPEVFKLVGQKFKTSIYRCKRRGAGFPAGPNDMVHDLFNEYWARFLRVRQFAETFDGVYLFEADNVPLRKDWLDVIVAEWKKTKDEKKALMGCFQDIGSPVGHINGNMVFVPDLFNRVRGLEGCPSQIAWDLFHAQKFEPIWRKADYMANLYRATKVPKSWLFDRKGKAKFAVVHGIKDDSAWGLAKAAF